MDHIVAANTSTPNNIIQWSTVFAYKQAMVIGCGLMFFQAMSGITSVIFYSTSIFAYAGYKDSIAATTSVGAVNLIFTTIGAILVDYCGRKPLLLTGISICL